MTNIDLQKRFNNSSALKVMKVSDDNYFVESSKGNVSYKVIFNSEIRSCTCPDFQTKSKNDEGFLCKHIIAVMNGQHITSNVKPKLDDRFITNIKGKDFVVWAGLLDAGHQLGIKKLTVEIIQLPTSGNGQEAICKATLETPNGSVFTDVADANLKNTSKNISLHILRMASTRAKARALRDYTNIGMTCLEELGNIDDVVGNEPVHVKPKIIKPISKDNKTNEKPKENKKVETKNKVEQKPKGEIKKETTSKTNSITGTKPKISEAQKKAILNLARRRGLSVEEVEQRSEEAFNTKFEHLSSNEASSFIRNLQAA